MAVACVRIRFDEMPIRWLQAVADLLTAVDHADAVMVEGPVRDAADRVREVVWEGCG